MQSDNSLDIINEYKDQVRILKGQIAELEDANKSKDSANKRCLQKLEFCNKDLEDALSKIKELELITLKENFWKDKDLVKKTLKQKKIFEEILNSYKKSVKDLDNLKDLFNLALQEKDDETIEDCEKKIQIPHLIYFLFARSSWICFFMQCE